MLGDGGKRHQTTLKALLNAGASVKLSDQQATRHWHWRARGYREMVAMLKARWREVARSGVVETLAVVIGSVAKAPISYGLKRHFS